MRWLKGHPLHLRDSRLRQLVGTQTVVQCCEEEKSLVLYPLLTTAAYPNGGFVTSSDRSSVSRPRDPKDIVQCNP